MSEAEQDEASQQVAELLVELTDVRKKRDQLDAQNLRVTDNLRRTIQERDKALANAESLRAEYLKVKESANTSSDNVAALIEQAGTLSIALRDMTAERDRAAAKWDECCKDRGRQAKALREQLAEMTAERDAARADVRSQLAAKNVIISERDAAELERTESRAQVVRLRAERDAGIQVNGSANRMIEALQGDVRQWQAERDAVREQLARVREGADMLEQENTSLRDTIQQLRAKQIHGDLPGLLMAIQLAAEQARLLI